MRRGPSRPGSELRGLLRRARHALAEAAQATGDADLAARVAAEAMAD